MFVPLPLTKRDEEAPPAEPEFQNGEAILGDEHDVCDFTLDYSALQYVQIDPIKKRVVASDSRHMVIVPLNDADGVPFLVEAEVLRRAYSVRKSWGHPQDGAIIVKSNDSGVSVSLLCKDGNRVTFSHPHFEPHKDAKGVSARFPNVDAVTPTPETNSSFAICLNAELLRNIAEHAKRSSNKDYPSLYFKFSDDKSAVLVTLDAPDPGYGATYVLMPLEVSN